MPAIPGRAKWTRFANRWGVCSRTALKFRVRRSTRLTSVCTTRKASPSSGGKGTHNGSRRRRMEWCRLGPCELSLLPNRGSIRARASRRRLRVALRSMAPCTTQFCCLQRPANCEHVGFCSKRVIVFHIKKVAEAHVLKNGDAPNPSCSTCIRR